MNSKDIAFKNLLFPFFKNFVEALEFDKGIQETIVKKYIVIRFPNKIRFKVKPLTEKELKPKKTREDILYLVYSDIIGNMANLENNFSNFKELITKQNKADLDKIIPNKAHHTEIIASMFPIDFDYTELFNELLHTHWSKLQIPATLNHFFDVVLTPELEGLKSFYIDKIYNSILELELFNEPQVLVVCAYAFLAQNPELLPILTEKVEQFLCLVPDPPEV